MRECDLYESVRELFAGEGYKVNAEVCDCDVTAIKDDELVIIELKLALSVKLFAQALERQKTGAKVYVAVPKPKGFSPRKFRDVLYVIKKLELGLIFVTLRDDFSFAEKVIEPQPFKPVGKRYYERKKIIKEINGRKLDTNTGGVTRKKIATAFTEKCIFIACVLERFGALSPKQISEYIGGEPVGGLLYRNNYGWFDRPQKGVYDINDKCRAEISDYPELLSYYTKKVSDLD